MRWSSQSFLKDNYISENEDTCVDAQSKFTV